MSTNVYINARFLTQPVTGVQRFAIELVKALDNLVDSRRCGADNRTFTLLAPRNIRQELNLKRISLKLVGRLKGHAWEQLELPRYSGDGLLLNLCNTGPLSHKCQVATIHDAAVYAYPRSYSAAFRAWYRFLLPRLGRVAKKIITVSYFSKKELIRQCNIREDKIDVIYPGKEHILAVEPDFSILDKYNLVGSKFILAVSSMNPSKNFGAVIKAIDKLTGKDFQFVIAGGTNPSVFSDSKMDLPENVMHVGYVTDRELRALYDKAACFVFPSLYEGFGLPPLEAMACGCPVVVSDAASLPEVCGNAGLYCDPKDPDDIAVKINMVMDDNKLRESLRQEGLERAEAFTWENTAGQILALLQAFRDS